MCSLEVGFRRFCIKLLEMVALLWGGRQLHKLLTLYMYWTGNTLECLKYVHSEHINCAICGRFCLIFHELLYHIVYHVFL
jgi:hypothetical protein